jgi:hypothetical protein
MSILNEFDYHIPEFTEIVKTLEKAGVRFDWYSETPPNLITKSGKITQQLVIEKQDFFLCISATKKGAVKKGIEVTPAPVNQKIIPFPTVKKHSA